jgi:hypothetical protein
VGYYSNHHYIEPLSTEAQIIWYIGVQSFSFVRVPKLKLLRFSSLNREFMVIYLYNKETKKMRKFSSYGPIDRELHYYVPRQALIDVSIQQLKGENLNKGGHYITIWASRQTGKTWIMREVFLTLEQETDFDVVILSLQFLSSVTDGNRVAQQIARELIEVLNLEITIDNLDDFHLLFKRGTLTKPLILIFDEFDALDKKVITELVAIFRHIYNTRQNQVNKSSAEKTYLLHSMALIGVRAVLGVENLRGSPFNVQRSVHIPNLTADPFEDVSDTITEDKLNIRRLLQQYEQYLQINQEQVLKNAPRRQNDLRIYEAVFHFHLYFYLLSFLGSYEGQVQPDFPTGNGTIDLLIRHAGQLFSLELKSFANQPAYRNALIQAAKYGKQLEVKEIWLVLFVDSVDENNRQKFE